MIKIFNATDTDFKTAGNIIINPLHCHEIKKKSLNGWYIEVEIPIKYKEYIEADKLCVVKTKSKLKPQAFRINDSITYTNRKIKFTAEHVMFDSRRYVLLDVRPTNLNGQNGLKYVNERTDKISPFSITSNVENVSTAYFIRKTLLESWQVFEERWGGVFEADNWDISFKQSIGKDNGETIVYGKNMQGFEIFEDWSNVCTKILPVGYDGLLLPEKYLESETQYEIPYTKIVDFQTDLKTEEQTETNLLVELRNNASKYLEENCIPKVSYTVNSNVNNDLEIGDTIKVLHPFVNIFTEVLEYEYDLISEKVKSLTFGNYTRDVKTKFNNIKNTIETIKQTVSKQEITIKEQTNLINSLNKNGYVYIDDNEILILDQLPKEKAKNVWRFGLGGIGFSSKGYEGPFETAITMDGKINADFITTGTMAVDRIESLANFITDTSASIAAIELQQDSITTKVSSVEQSVENITNTQNTATGKNIHLEDSSDDPLVSIKVKGSTNQATRSGKNLLDIKNENMQTSYCTKEYNGNSLTLTSTETAMPARTTIPVDYPLNKALTISFDATFLKGYDLNNNSVVYFRSNNTNIGSITLTKDNQKHSYSITIPNGIAEEGYTFWLYIKPSRIEGVVSIKFDNIQIEEGSIATDYEEYGASPSPDYPSPIENVEGKNIWNKSEISEKTQTVNMNVGELNVKDVPIPFTFSSYLISNALTDTNVRVSFADSNNSNIGAVKYGNTVTSTNKRSSITINEIPEGTVKIKFSIRMQDGGHTEKTQLEAGTVATPYVPYNSLAVKVEGKNLFDIKKSNNINSGTDFSIADNKIIINNNNSGYGIYADFNLKPNTQYTVSSKSIWNITRPGNAGWRIRRGKTWLDSSGKDIYSFVTDNNTEYRLAYYIGIPNTNVGTVELTEIQLEEETQLTEFEPYQEQVATFPLGEEKLMEGSYLADDGIHHSRKQVVLDGSDDEDWKLWGASLSNVERFYVNLDVPTKNINTTLCSHFKFLNANQDEEHFRWSSSQGVYKQFVIFIDKSKATTVAELKTWLQSNPITVEYELATEEIVPYTEAQQEAWNKIEQLHTYKNVTNIFSDTELDIVYVRDNGLSDMYETKQNASKNYTKTSTEIQQLDDSIKRTISQIGDRSQKTTTVTEDIDGIKNEVSKIQDLTQTTSGTKTIALSNCAKGNLLKLQIKGNNTVFKYLYPSNNLYPANNLLPMGDSRILVNDIQYELGVLDTLRQNGEVYDEFVLENGQAKVIRRINTDGTVKTEEMTEDLGKLSISLNDGTNIIKILNYSAEIIAKYATKNNYTDIFATKVEMSSSIEQTAEGINQVVRKKVDEDEIISKINQSAEEVEIDANRININGAVSANGNFKVDTERKHEM